MYLPDINVWLAHVVERCRAFPSPPGEFRFALRDVRQTLFGVGAHQIGEFLGNVRGLVDDGSPVHHVDQPTGKRRVERPRDQPNRH